MACTWMLGQLTGVSSLLPFVFQGPSSENKVQQQATLPTEPSIWSTDWLLCTEGNCQKVEKGPER